MKKLIVLVGLAPLLVSPALAQAPAGVYGSGNIIFPNDPAAAAAAGAYGAGILPGAAGAFAYEPSRTEAKKPYGQYSPGTSTSTNRHIYRGGPQTGVPHGR